MNVKATLKKTKKGIYQGELEIENSSSNDITSWYITTNLNNGNTIDEVRNCTISLVDNKVTLVPESKISTLKKGKTIDLKFSGKGDMSTQFTGVVGPIPPPIPPTPGQPTYVYNLPMTDLKDISQLTKAGDGFKYQWSYDKMKGFSNVNPNPDYFKLVGENGLEINLYQGDKPFESGSSTEPRTELRGLAKVLDNLAYTYSFDQYLVDLPTFDYCWCQVFGGNGPNIMLRWRSGSFQLMAIQGDHGSVKFEGNPQDDVGKWVNWKIEFLLSTQNGYAKVYRNNILLATLNGNNTGANDSYIKNGIYAQQMKPSNNVKVYKKNLMLYY